MTDVFEFNMDSQEYEVWGEEWWKSRILENGKLSDLNTTSEFERGFIDCWNMLWKEFPKHIKISARYL